MSETEIEILNYNMENNYLEAALDSSHDGIYITDEKANTIYINRGYELISGLKKTELIGKNMQDLLDHGVISISGTLKVLESGEPYTTEQVFRTQKRAVITSTPVRSPDGRIIMVVTNVRDVTEIHSIRKELRKKEMQNLRYYQELESLRNELAGGVDIVAIDKASVSILRFAKRVALVNSPIMLLGERGVGREKIAQYIHSHSDRAQMPFVRITLDENDADRQEAYLFGTYDSVKGEYEPGLIEAADGGTVYFDEITDLLPEMQTKILSIMRNGSFTVNGTIRNIDIRLIAGTCKTKKELKTVHKQNTSLIEQFELFQITVPPLRERKDDIVPLLNYFLGQYNTKTGENKRFSHKAYMYLMEYKWPGNVMELRNLVERAAIISEEEIILLEDLFVEGNLNYIQNTIADMEGDVNLKEEVEKFEADYMTRAFNKFKNARSAAESLGMDASTFIRKRQRYEKMGLMEKQPKKK